MQGQFIPVVTRPGPGWYHVGSACWDNSKYDVRVHVGGHCLVKLSGNFISGTVWPESRNLDRCIEICGGNRRRGVMIWAMNLVENGYG